MKGQHRERIRSLPTAWSAQRPTRVEGWALVGLLAAALVASLALAAVDGIGDPRALTFELLLTSAFLLVIWNATLTAVLLLALTALSPLIDAQQVALLALAVGCLVVLRYCSAWVQAAYLGAFLAAAAAIHRLDQRPDSMATFSAVLMVAAGASATGIVLRAVVTKGTRAREELRDARRLNAELVQQERQRIADDLHDVVAHDLTVIAMHARLLDRTDDPRERERSQAAIIASARQALVDLRRVVHLAVDAREEAAPSMAGSVSVAVQDFRSALERAGYEVEVEVAPDASEGLDRLTVSGLERVIREAATNVLKHAPAPERVRLELAREDGMVALRIWNSLSRPARASLVPSGGYGTARIRERAGLLGGTFSAGRSTDGWLLDVSFPLS